MLHLAAAFLLTITAGPPRFQDSETAYQAVVSGPVDSCMTQGADLAYILAGQQQFRDFDRNNLIYWLPNGSFRWSCQLIDPNRSARDQG